MTRAWPYYDRLLVLDQWGIVSLDKVFADPAALAKARQQPGSGAAKRERGSVDRYSLLPTRLGRQGEATRVRLAE